MNWIENFLFKAVTNRLCTRIHCTTCGALPFRQGILTALAKKGGQPPSTTLDKETALELAKELAKVDPSKLKGLDLSNLERAARCLIYDLYYCLNTSNNNLESLLGSSWAGSVLTAMKSHYTAACAAQKEAEASAVRRREESRLAKKEQHLARLERKKVRDLDWYAKHGNSSIDDGS